MSLVDYMSFKTSTNISNNSWAIDANAANLKSRVFSLFSFIFSLPRFCSSSIGLCKHIQKAHFVKF